MHFVLGWFKLYFGDDSNVSLLSPVHTSGNLLWSLCTQVLVVFYICVIDEKYRNEKQIDDTLFFASFYLH
jgi:hypothetical protein